MLNYLHYMYWYCKFEYIEIWFILLLTLRVNSNCIWNVTKEIGNLDKPKFLIYNGSGRSLISAQAYRNLSNICPQYALRRGIPVCCTDDHITYFYKNIMQIHQFMKRCPACWANIRQLLCGLICDPNQSDFLKPTIVNNLVLKVEYSVTRLVADTLFNSCKNVQSGRYLASESICMEEHCTPELFLESLANHPRGFPTEFRITSTDDRSSKSFNATFYQCNTAIKPFSGDPGGPSCSCTDCENSCSWPLLHHQGNITQIVFGFNPWLVGSFFAFVVLIMAFACFVIGTYFCRKRQSTRLLKPNFDAVHYQTRMILPDFLDATQARMEVCMCRAFAALGRTVARYPFIALIISILVSAGLSAGLTFITVTTNPVALWSSPTSRSRLEKKHFDHTFNPFYRIEQLIIRPRNQSFFTRRHPTKTGSEELFGPALEKHFLVQVLQLQNELRSFKIYSLEFKQNVSLSDVCFKPMAPVNLNCYITSPLEYFQGDAEKFNKEAKSLDYLDHLRFCVNAPYSMENSPLDSSYSCFSSADIPIEPKIAFGGFDGTNYKNATSIVITFLVNNHPDPQSEHVRKAKLWESGYLEQIRDWLKNHSEMAIVSYTSERSVEDEIIRQSNSDVFTVILSYAVMFVYLSIFLGSYRNCQTSPVDLRITLGLGGVIIVIISVVSSLGMWSYFGFPATLIIIEVTQFFVLSVGVDNIFLLVHDLEIMNNEVLRSNAGSLFKRTNFIVGQVDQSNETFDRKEALSDIHISVNRSVESRIERTLGRVGPSLLLSSSTEAVALFCGSLTTTPVLRALTLYSGVAIVFNFCLQMFAFVALLTLETRRQTFKRFDVLFCFGLPDDTKDDSNSAHGTEQNAKGVGSYLYQTETVKPKSNDSSWLHQAVAHFFAPFILSGWTRPIVVVISLAWACLAIAIIPNGLHIGLDQRLSMPDDSYMLDYFNALASDLRVGPPVYFVVTAGHNYSAIEGQNAVCGNIGCDRNSLMERISSAAKHSAYTRISQPAFSWIDEYFDWIDPHFSTSCCRLCTNNVSPDACKPCPVTMEHFRLIPDDFNKHVVQFLGQKPTKHCPKGGLGVYNAAVQIKEHNVIGATYFMTYHTVLSQPDDYLEALRQTRNLVDQINKEWHGNKTGYTSDRAIANDSVYAYSIFYVFYEQYLSMYKDAALQLGICLAAVTALTFILLDLNITATLMVLFGLLYILLSMFAMMVLWKIDLNALSLINLVVTVGIGVEFCAHIVRAFTVSMESTRLARSKAALTSMGSSILRGVTLTKLVGIIVLAFSKSRLFQVFYFRMYLGIIFCGAYTGLILLPVALSYFGPSLNNAQKYFQRVENTKRKQLATPY